MPKISDLPADTAPASTDLIPFVDVDAARTESVTVANLAASTAFSGTYAPWDVGGRGAVCFTFDDGYPSWTNIIAACNPGQHVTFFTNSTRIDAVGGVTTATLAAAVAVGHEVGSHGTNGTAYTSLTAAQRDAQSVACDAAILSATGVAVKSFSYPAGSRSSTTDPEMLHRYDRVFTIGDPSAKVHRANRPGQFVFGRQTWADNTRNITLQDDVLGLIRLAATQPVVVTIYAHDPDNGSGSFANDPTMVQVQAAFDLCASLGVPMLTVSEALPSAPVGIVNGGFEEGLAGWSIVNTAAYTVEVVTDTPPDGFPGTKSLHVVSSGATNCSIGQRVSADPAVPWNFSFRYRTVSGVGMQTRVTEYGYDGTQLASTVSGGQTNASWSLYNRDVTLNAATVSVEAVIATNGGATEFYADHVSFGPQAWGKFG